ncbi:MBL fold metallo-hydrolase [Hymenobacter terrenus]|uniref:MBL fold metallo-hydrolase n=1 Tax=Hymenobacter terrenus TaxID=1629124 RepID=UPI000696BD19|nr:MBL fold metallo-hydrolase [Hymenobacter terrenus]
MTISLAPPYDAELQPAPPIQCYTSRPEAFFVNSYLVETTAGIVVIDTQFLLSEAQGLRAQLRATGRPLAAIFVTHPHPDHFNGVGVLLEDGPSVPVYATQATADGIAAVEATKRAYWTPIHGADYPTRTTLPTHILHPGETVTVGGLDFVVEEWGEGETSNMMTVYLPASGTLFAGDLAYHQVHPWLAESHSQAWLTQLARAQQHYQHAHAVYVGHGQPGTPTMLAEQADYIVFFKGLVEQHLSAFDNAPLPEAARASIRQEVLRRYPDLPLAGLIELNINGIVAELQSSAH